MTTPWPQDTELKTLLDQLRHLREQGVYFAAIRHHSPSCARYVVAWLRQIQPKAVLIEGPSRANPLIPLIRHPAAKAPLAIYRYHPQQVGGWFYPLCDYSPEWQALRQADCPVYFIDLDDRQRHDMTPEVVDLLNDAYLSQSQYLKALAQKTRCPDTDALWDHLFELRQPIDPCNFFDEVAAYCALGRRDILSAALEADETLARERQMAAWIGHYRKQYGTPLLIVTGGFHTAALPFSLDKADLPQAVDESYQTHLVRYSFAQLDRLRGYSAGMPHPGYYQKCWEYGDLTQVSTEILMSTARLARDGKLPRVLSTADVTAAVFHAQQLARLRGRVAPGRVDLLDAIKSVFVKGDDEGEQQIITAIVNDLLRGNTIGELPLGVELPPLLVDFNRKIKALKLPLTSESRKLDLEPRRKPQHRVISQLLNCLDLLQVRYSRRLDGGSLNRRRIHEIWECQWSPGVDSRLIELAFLGESLEQAASTELRRHREKLVETGQHRRCQAQVSLLGWAIRCGLETALAESLAAVEQTAQEDNEVRSLAEGLFQLKTMADDIPTTLRYALWARACYLVPEWVNCPEDQQEQALKILILLHNLQDEVCEAGLFHDALTALLRNGSALLRGGAAGLLWADSVLPDESLTKTIQIGMAASLPKERVAILRGVLVAAKGALLQIPVLLTALHEQFLQWDEATFLTLLPELRLTFTAYTPREIDRVSEKIAEFCGLKVPVEINYQLDESALAQQLALEHELVEQLKQDHLESWLREC